MQWARAALAKRIWKCCTRWICTASAAKSKRPSGFKQVCAARKQAKKWTFQVTQLSDVSARQQIISRQLLILWNKAIYHLEAHATVEYFCSILVLQVHVSPFAGLSIIQITHLMQTSPACSNKSKPCGQNVRNFNLAYTSFSKYTPAPLIQHPLIWVTQIMDNFSRHQKFSFYLLLVSTETCCRKAHWGTYIFAVLICTAIRTKLWLPQRDISFSLLWVQDSS